MNVRRLPCEVRGLRSGAAATSSQRDEERVRFVLRGGLECLDSQVFRETVLDLLRSGGSMLVIGLGLSNLAILMLLLSA